MEPLLVAGMVSLSLAQTGAFIFAIRASVRESARRDVAERAERNSLLERIQRPDVPIVTDELGQAGNAFQKLWQSEGDEIEAARAAAITRIDELAHETGGL